MYSGDSHGLADGRARYLLGIACYVSIGNLIFGFDVATSAGVLAQGTFHEALTPNLAEQGAFISLMSAGAFFGSAISGRVSDKCSRKWTIMLGGSLAIVGSAMQVSAFSMAQILVGRFNFGLAIGLMTMVVPLYCSELSSLSTSRSRIRSLTIGIPGCMYFLGIVMGHWTMYACTYYLDERQWRLPLAIPIAWALVCIWGISILPHSPIWLLKRGREEEARQVIHRLYRKNGIAEDEIDSAFKFKRDSVYSQESHHTQISDLWSTQDMKLRTFVACGIATFSQWTGISVTTFYGPALYQYVGFRGRTSVLIHGVYGLATAISNIVFVTFILNRVGRKKALLFGNMSLVCIFAMLLALLEERTVHQDFSIAIVAMIILVPVSVSTSYDSVGFLYASELFPLRHRSDGMAVVACVNWLWSVLVTAISPAALENIFFGYFVVFLGVNAIAFFAVLIYFPETKGRAYERVSAEITDKETGSVGMD